MTMNGRPSCSPTSKIVTVFGREPCRGERLSSEAAAKRIVGRTLASTLAATAAEQLVLRAVDLAHAASPDRPGVVPGCQGDAVVVVVGGAAWAGEFSPHPGHNVPRLQ